MESGTRNKITLRDLIKRPESNLRLVSIYETPSLDNEVKNSGINRPGLCFAGYFDYFAFDRIQIFGNGEWGYLEKTGEDDLIALYDKFFSYDLFCCIFTYGRKPNRLFLEYAKKKKVPVLQSDLPTADFINNLLLYIQSTMAPVVMVHGTLVDVFGFGVLLIGKSGVGKSETALELIERGHRLIADDIVEVKRLNENTLAGTGSPLVRHHIEIRGLGILNIRDIYGIRSVRNRKKIELIVTLEEWNNKSNYDRTGLDEDLYDLLEVPVPHITVPVRPGRNIPIIVETAALNQRLKKMGVYSARELDRKIQNWMQMEKLQNV